MQTFIENVHLGEHAGNALAFQEFFIIPTGAETFREAMQIGCEVFHTLSGMFSSIGLIDCGFLVLSSNSVATMEVVSIVVAPSLVLSFFLYLFVHCRSSAILNNNTHSRTWGCLRRVDAELESVQSAMIECRCFSCPSVHKHQQMERSVDGD